MGFESGHSISPGSGFWISHGTPSWHSIIRHSIKWRLLWGRRGPDQHSFLGIHLLRNGLSLEQPHRQGPEGTSSDVQKGLSRGFGPEGQLQTLPPHPCSTQAASSHCPTSSPAAPQCFEVTGCWFYLQRTPAAGGQQDETCLTHAHACITASPPEPPWESSPPPKPLAHKKIKTLHIISHKRGFEAPSVTRHVPQSALAPDSWRCLLEDQNDFTPPPTDRGYPECLVRGGEPGGWTHSAPSPLRCHRAVPWTHQGGCWCRERPQALIMKGARDADAVPAGASEAAGPGCGAGEVYEG